MNSERLESKYATKELARDAKTPSAGSVKNLKRLVRFYKKFQRLVTVMAWQGARAGLPPVRILKGTADSNFANCLKTRKSKKQLHAQAP